MTATEATTDQLGVKPWQAREQSAEGTFIDAADGVGGVAYVDVYTALPPVTKASIKVGHTYRDVAQVGPEDLLAIKKGGKFVEFSLTMQITDSTKTFLKYLWNAADYSSPSGTPAKPLSAFFSQYVDNGSGTLTETYYKFYGVKVKTSTATLTEDGDWEIAADFIAIDLTITTTGLTTATAVTSYPSGETWSFDSGGTSNGTWNSTAVTMKEISTTFDRKTKAHRATGNKLPYTIRTHGRRIAGTVKIAYLGTAGPYTDAMADTAHSLAVIMKTSAYTMTLTNVKLKDLGEEHSGDSEDEIVHTWAFTALGFTDLS